GAFQPRVPQEAALGNARTVLSEARAWKKVLMIGPLPLSGRREANTRIAGFSRLLDALCAELEVPFFDALAAVESHAELWRRETDSGDGVHPNRGSYEALARAIGGWDAWRRWVDP